MRAPLPDTHVWVPAIAAEVAVLPSAFHRDPADRVIVATCRIMNVPLLTRDHRILRSRLVKPLARHGATIAAVIS